MTLRDFYDPDLYELNIGLAPRVGPLYLSVLADLPAAGSVMELGCGIGDVLLPFAHKGHRVYGVDGSARMLERFDKRAAGDNVRSRVELVECALPSLPDTDRVDALLMPNDIVSHLLTDDDVIQLFRNAHSAVVPGGVVVLDIARFDVERLGSLIGAAGQLTRTHGVYTYLGDHSLRVSEQTTYTPENGVLSCTFQYNELDAGGKLVDTWFRVLELAPRRIREITAVLESAGFIIQRVDTECFPKGMDNVLVRACVA
jgi:SAM-dependent methyltransferase